MTSEQDIIAFLQGTDWFQADQTPLAGDASARRYRRLSRGKNTAILMIAPPKTCGPLAPFQTIAAHLSENGLRAPKIFASNTRKGLMLLEDFGDNLLATLAETSPSQAKTLYRDATKVLVKLHHAPLPNSMRETTTETLTQMTGLVFDYYAPNVSKHDQDNAKAALLAHLNGLPKLPPSLSLRDYHAENIVWLGSKEIGTDAMGLLDFQDAFVTHPAYDLVSLCQDARRDVSHDIEKACIASFLQGTKLNETAFIAGYHAIGLQRNLRILGVFCRLASERQKPQYLSLLPRVWAHVQNSLAQPGMEKPKAAFACLPAPEDR